MTGDAVVRGEMAARGDACLSPDAGVVGACFEQYGTHDSCDEQRGRQSWRHASMDHPVFLRPASIATLFLLPQGLHIRALFWPDGSRVTAGPGDKIETDDCQQN